MRNIPPLNWLRAFEATARLRSFSQAGQELNVTPSAISQHIKSLENYLDTTLLIRQPQIQLTDAGKQYLPTVSQAFSQLAIATNDVFGQTEQTVQLCCSVAFSSLFIVPRLESFRRAHPDIEIQFHNNVWWENRDNSRSHLEIRYGYGNWQEPSILLTKDVLAPMVGKGYPTLVASAQTFKQHPLFQVSGLRHNWHEWFRLAGIQTDGVSIAKPIIYSDSVIPIYLMALQNQGIALLSHCYTDSALRNGNLIQPFETLLPTEESFYLIQPDKTNRAEHYFSEWLIEQFD